MEADDGKSRAAANRSKRVMIMALLGSTLSASIIAVVLSRSILDPIRAVIRSSRALAEGDSDQVVPVTWRDELGELASTFNGMVRTLREFRQAGTDLIGDAIGRFESRARDAGIDLTGGADRPLPRILVDRERIEHVFDNLIGNALAKTHRAGSVCLSAGLDGDRLRFAVTDTGEGIPPASSAEDLRAVLPSPGFATWLRRVGTGDRTRDRHGSRRTN